MLGAVGVISRAEHVEAAIDTRRAQLGSATRPCDGASRRRACLTPRPRFPKVARQNAPRFPEPSLDARTGASPANVVRQRAEHAAFVDRWLGNDGASPGVVLRRLDEALAVVWSRTVTMLGEMTLAVIAERVVWNASEQFPFLSALQVDPSRGIVCDGVLARLRPGDGAELERAARFVLVELLTVLGNLTAGLLSEPLHEELAKLRSVAVPPGPGEPNESSGNGSGSATS